MEVETNGFSSIGGLQSNIQCIIEMILTPLECPDFYQRHQIRSPKGLLFYGAPGTGKTLLARAIASECKTRKINFISSSIADILCKWVGESEKRLADLFKKASQSHPCIIFFDELDGLAPIRTERNDQVHTTVVNTLLQMMDGLERDSEVVVVGATNRIENIDPALRRPGRFDLELFFPLPSLKERLDILKIYTNNWGNKPNSALLQTIANETNCFCGADLKAVCTLAITRSLKRHFPDMYKNINRLPNINDRVHLEVDENDFNEALMQVVPAYKRCSSSMMRPLPHALKPLLGPLTESIMERLEMESSFKSLHANHKKMNVFGGNWNTNVGSSGHYLPWPRLVICGNEMQGHTRHLAPALLHHLEHLPCSTLDIINLHSIKNSSPEECIKSVMRNLLHMLPGILYLPDLCGWWSNVELSAQQVFLKSLSYLETNTPVLLIVTVHQPYRMMPDELQEIFNLYQSHVYEIINPSKDERVEFFKKLMIKVFIPPSIKEKTNYKEISGKAERQFDRILGNHQSISSFTFKTPIKETGPKWANYDISGKSIESSGDSSSKKRKFEDSGEGVKLGDSGMNKNKTHQNVSNPHVRLRERIKNKGGYEFDLLEMKIDVDGLLQVFKEIIELTCDCPILTLEKLYAGLDSKIAKYEKIWDRRNLTLDLKKSLEDFNRHILKLI